MKKNSNQEQIISILREGESGISVSYICHNHGISKSTYHKYAGMSISDSVKLKALEQGDNRLKRLVYKVVPLV
jgi:putative transposase